MKSEFSVSGFLLTCIVLCGILIMTGLSYTPMGAINAGGIAAAETTAANHFEIKTRPIKNETAVTVDWNNMASLKGQALYDDGQSTITVTDVVAENGNYNLHLEAVGEIASSGGRLVTPVSHDGSMMEGKLMVVVGDQVFISTLTEANPSVLHAGDTAVVPVFADEVPAEEIAANDGQVTVQLIQLHKINFFHSH